jgi:hypothetical protein
MFSTILLHLILSLIHNGDFKMDPIEWLVLPIVFVNLMCNQNFISNVYFNFSQILVVGKWG